MNAHFLPAADEVAFAERVVAAQDNPDSIDSETSTVDGRMVDRPVVLRAREVLDSARRFGQS